MQENESSRRRAGSPIGTSKTGVPEGLENYVTRVLSSVLEVNACAWDALLAAQDEPTPFMRHAYLAAMQATGAAVAATGWAPRFITLWQGDMLVAACPLYLKAHSYGEYVFDWAWANAYEQHGLTYYPKAIIAVPFTPVPGARLLAINAAARTALLQAALGFCETEAISSLHILFASKTDLATCNQARLMQRHTVQFHWNNCAPEPAPAVPELPATSAAMTSTAPGGQARYADFDAFQASLSQEKRKKIRQERRKVQEAGVHFRWAHGTDISAADWDFFYRCYERTYLEHGNPPYLNRAFFDAMARDMPENWLLFTGERNGTPIATSLIAINDHSTMATGPKESKNAENRPGGSSLPDGALGTIAYGRYWGALERVDCLHFEACYYQPLAWCIAHGIHRFEGGAQGEHKLARALLPVKATSAHWLAHPAFADAVERFLDREGDGVGNYLAHLDTRSPLKKPV